MTQTSDPQERFAFTADEVRAAISLQTELFKPSIDEAKLKETSKNFLQDNIKAKRDVLAFMFYQSYNARNFNIEILIETARCLVAEGLMSEDEFISVFDDPKLFEEDAYSKITSLEAERDVRNPIINYIEEDNLEGFIAEIADYPNWLEEVGFGLPTSLVVKGIGICFFFRAFKCLDYLIQQGVTYDQSLARVAITALSKEEFLKYFQMPEDISLYSIVAALYRVIWVLEEIQDERLKWETINLNCVFIEAKPDDPWAPWRFVQNVRPSFNYTIDVSEWDKWCDISDKIFDGEEVDIDSPLIQFIEADAALKRLRDFDLHVERMIKNITDIEEVMRWRKYAAFFAFVNGYQMPAVVRDEFFDPLKEEGGDSDQIQLMHPNYLLFLGQSLFDDNVPAFVQSLEQLSEDEMGELGDYLDDKLFTFPIIGDGRDSGEDYMMECAALYGSHKCFEYMYSDMGIEVNEFTVNCAFAGGNLSIINQVRGMKEFKLSNLKIATLISYRRWGELEWYLENMEVENMSTIPMKCLFPYPRWVYHFPSSFRYDEVVQYPKPYWKYYMQLIGAISSVGVYCNPDDVDDYRLPIPYHQAVTTLLETIGQEPSYRAEYFN